MVMVGDVLKCLRWLETNKLHNLFLGSVSKFDYNFNIYLNDEWEFLLYYCIVEKRTPLLLSWFLNTVRSNQKTQVNTVVNIRQLPVLIGTLRFSPQCYSLAVWLFSFTDMVADSVMPHQMDCVLVLHILSDDEQPHSVLASFPWAYKYGVDCLHVAHFQVPHLFSLVSLSWLPVRSCCQHRHRHPISIRPWLRTGVDSVFSSEIGTIRDWDSVKVYFSALD